MNSSTVQSFHPKAMRMLNTARPSACVLREVSVGRISSCGLLPAHSIDCSPRDLRCMTIMARRSGLTLTLTFVELKKNIQWEASCNLRKRTLLHARQWRTFSASAMVVLFFFMCRGLKFASSSSILSGGTYFTDEVQ